MQFMGSALQAGGAFVQGVQQKNADDYNAAVMGQEKSVALAQGYEAEAQQRRRGAMISGREVAAAGQAGAGYGGSVGRSLKQSAVNQELDALNIRYKASLQGWAYGEQAKNLTTEGKTAMADSFLKAGASLLKGYSAYGGGTDLG